MSCPLAACCQSSPLERDYSSSQVSETKAVGRAGEEGDDGALDAWGSCTRGLDTGLQYSGTTSVAAVSKGCTRGSST